ncbi:MAG: Galactose-1-phosphate uridylyltransferase [Syntrophorhabdus sp. PtaU1.Bin002]|nr:MAG: Galactose-1-phosphate uridylyltransferase [Syntrophorhabdus sp. PtaB.Bin006]OPY70084.1 MAG: Galactose-1-phosphate uridylyltransferase [Syntrophorhabdus sp. PtaU1.Bin002]
MTKNRLYPNISTMAELRKDPISGDWVVSGYTSTRINSTGECPFCPGNEKLTPQTIREIKGMDGAWAVRCFAATSPIFVIEVAEQKRAEGLYDKMGNVGAHEIIVEHRFHTTTMSSFSEAELGLVFDMYIDRIIDLKKDKRFRHVNIFKNHGELAGSYIFHPHSHVLATPIVPQRMELELANAKRHYMQKERCLFCDILSQEIRQNKRVVSMNGNFITLCPFASKFPYETWVLPRLHEARFENLKDEGMRHDLIAIVLDLLKRIEKLTNAYTIVLHTSPNLLAGSFDNTKIPLEDYYHWHIEILPRDFRSSKYKREDEFHVVSITPEEAANSLKMQKT